MPPFRNLFVRKAPNVSGIPSAPDENAAPSIASRDGKVVEERSSLSASRTSSVLSIKPNKEPDEFQLSVVNDSGVYLPPSPPDRKSFWHRTPSSNAGNPTRPCLSENEPFSISRESFESYRRSFDISARSPVSHSAFSSPRLSSDAAGGRASLDSHARASPRTPRSAMLTGSQASSFSNGHAAASLNGSARFDRPLERDEDDAGFEDVRLGEDPKPASKRRGLFSRFADPADTPPPSDKDEARPTSSHAGHGRFHLPGRKRGQSTGQGAELGDMDGKTPPASDADDTVTR